MNKLLSALSVLILALLAAGCASDSEKFNGMRVGTPQFEEYAGVYRLYPAADLRRGDCPKGYKPVYISHYGRHGSRYLIYDSQYVQVADVLKKAYEDGKLTAFGKDVHDRYMSIYPQLKGRADELTQIGMKQPRVIAKRMYHSYPEIFGADPVIEAYTTMTGRTMLTMAGFCESLKEEDPELNIFQEATILNIRKLNPYHAAANVIPEEERASFKGPKATWLEGYKAYMEEVIDPSAFISRLFTDAEYVSEICVPSEFMRNLRYVAIHLQGTDQCSTSFTDVFTDEELAVLWECDNITYYMEKGHGFNSSRCPIYSYHMLEALIEDAEKALSSESPTVHLRFGHDGCMIALFALMDVEGWNAHAESFAEIKNVFGNWRTPMAANFQMVFYRGGAGNDVLMRFYLNEEPYPLPLEEVGNMFYRWSDFKQVYMDKVRWAAGYLARSR